MSIRVATTTIFHDRSRPRPNTLELLQHPTGWRPVVWRLRGADHFGGVTIVYEKWANEERGRQESCQKQR